MNHKTQVLDAMRDAEVTLAAFAAAMGRTRVCALECADWPSALADIAAGAPSGGMAEAANAVEASMLRLTDEIASAKAALVERGP
jgi:hypothetical protein